MVRDQTFKCPWAASKYYILTVVAFLPEFVTENRWLHLRPSATLYANFRPACSSSSVAFFRASSAARLCGRSNPGHLGQKRNSFGARPVPTTGAARAAGSIKYLVFWQARLWICCGRAPLSILTCRAGCRPCWRFWTINRSAWWKMALDVDENLDADLQVRGVKASAFAYQH